MSSSLIDIRYESVQEIVFNANIILICGKAEVSWLRMTTALMNIRNSSTSTRVFEARTMNALQKTAELWSSNNSWNDSESLSKPYNKHIINLVSDFCRYDCTDDRDRIFAVHSLSNGRDARMRIDYGQSAYTTYRQFALACMADGKTSAVLEAAITRPHVTNTTDWPSWVPDWRREPIRHDKNLPSRGMCTFTGNVHNNIATLKFQCPYPHI